MKSSSMQLDPNLIGKKFNVNSTDEYVCVGFAQNETFCIFGAKNDTPNNRFSIKSFKLTDVNFIGQA